MFFGNISLLSHAEIEENNRGQKWGVAVTKTKPKTCKNGFGMRQ
jgi:hypothetical protein